MKELKIAGILVKIDLEEIFINTYFIIVKSLTRFIKTSLNKDAS